MLFSRWSGGGISRCRWCWICRLFRGPLGLKCVHLRCQLADAPPRCLVVEVAFAPLVSQLELSVVARSTDAAGWLAVGMARRDGGKLLL